MDPQRSLGGRLHHEGGHTRLQVRHGSYSGTQTVTVSTVTPGASLHYTTNGLEPTTSDPTVVSGGTILVDRSATLRVLGVKAGWTSTSASGSYSLSYGVVQAPTFSPVGGTYTSAPTLTLSSATPGATIRYTTDDTAPTLASRVYAAPLTLSATTVVRARAFRADWTPSSTSSATYTLDLGTAAIPWLSPDGGTYAAKQRVTLSAADPGVTIRYTTSGLDPTPSDPAVAPGATILVDRSQVVKARAYKAGLADSPVRRADYTLTGMVAAGPDFTLLLKTEGSVWGWGQDNYGQLGDNTAGGPDCPRWPGRASARAPGSKLWPRGGFTRWRSGTTGPCGAGATTAADNWATAPTAGHPTRRPCARARSRASWRWPPATITRWRWALTAGSGPGGATATDSSVSASHRAAAISPLLVSSLSGVTAIAAGEYHSLAVRTDGAASGTLWAWGQNTSGQVGDGTSGTLVYLPNAGLTDVVAAAAGRRARWRPRRRRCAWAVGAVRLRAARRREHDRAYAAHGRPCGSHAGLPAAGAQRPGGRSLSLRGHRQPRCGVRLGGRHVRAARLFPDGSRDEPDRAGPVWPFRNAASVAAGSYHSAAVTVDGRVWTWGSNMSGQLGDGTTTAHVPPTPLAITAGPNGWASGDADGDGLATWMEYQIGSDPLNPDSNGDGLLDGVAVSAGLSATNPDMDADGLSNALERQRGTDTAGRTPTRTGWETRTASLDAARFQCPPPNPSDQTPPVITLTEPTNAQLISSIP